MYFKIRQRAPPYYCVQSHTSDLLHSLPFSLLGLGLLADHIGHLQLFVLAHLGRLGAAELKVLGDLLSDGRLLADSLHLLLALHVVAVGVGLGLCCPPVVEMSVVRQSWLGEIKQNSEKSAVTTFLTVFAHFDLLTVGVLVPGDLHEGLCLGHALLLHLVPAEVLGDGLQHPGALDVGVVGVAAVIKVPVTGRDVSLTSFTEALNIC